MPEVTKHRFCSEDGAFRLLSWPHGMTLLTGRTLAKGGYGKMRLGLDIRTENLFAIKESSGLEPRDSLGRRASSLDDVNLEIMLVDGLSPTLRCSGTYRLEGQAKGGYLMRPMAGDMNALICDRPDPLTREAQMAVAGTAGLAIALELAGLHRRGWLHGDVKLQNILFDADGTICLGDYGAPRRLDRNLEVSSDEVTSTIVAPERDLCETVGCAFDIYALGWTLWQLHLHDQPYYSVSGGTSIEDVLLEPEPSKRPGAPNDAARATALERAEMRALWQAFVRRDAELANFVRRRMLCPAESRCTAEQAAQHLARRGLNDALAKATMRGQASRLPVAAEAERLRSEHQAAMRLPGGPNDALGLERWRRMMLGPPPRKLEVTAYYSGAEVRHIELFDTGATLRLVNIPDTARCYAVGEEVAFGAHATISPVVYMDLPFSTVAYTYRDAPCTRHSADGSTRRIEAHSAAMADRFSRLSAQRPELLGLPLIRLSRQHHIAAEGSMITLASGADGNLAQCLALPSRAARVRLAYLAMRDAADILERCRRVGLVHRRVDLTHLLVKLHEAGQLSVQLAGVNGMTMAEPPSGCSGDDDALYPSPEVAHGGAYGPKNDIWALGLCIWQLVDPELDLTMLQLRPDDPQAAMQGTATFCRWLHARDLYADLQSSCPARAPVRAWERALARLERLEPSLARFLLQHMLVPSAERRCDAAAVRAFGADQLKASGGQEAAKAELLAHIEAMPLRRAQKRLEAQVGELVARYPGAKTRAEALACAFEAASG